MRSLLKLTEEEIKERKMFFSMVRETKEKLMYNHDQMAIFFNRPRATYIKWHHGVHVPKDDNYTSAIMKMEKVLLKKIF